MEKFAGIGGPVIFAAVIAVFGSSRPAVLSLIVLFILGCCSPAWTWTGRAIAQAEDDALFAARRGARRA